MKEAEEPAKKEALNFFTGLDGKTPPAFTEEMKGKASSYEEAVKQNQKSKISNCFLLLI